MYSFKLTVRAIDKPKHLNLSTTTVLVCDKHKHLNYMVSKFFILLMSPYTIVCHMAGNIYILADSE